MIKNTPTTFSGTTKFLHWSMAMLFVGMFVTAYVMTTIPDSDFKYQLYALHKATGLLLFGLVIFRLTWRYIDVQPQLLKSIPTWQRMAAKCNIIALYCMMFSMPLTGFLTSTLGGHDISFYSLFTLSPLGHNKNISIFFCLCP